MTVKVVEVDEKISEVKRISIRKKLVAFVQESQLFSNM